ncbi:unnamed protein product [Clavelina lepadiformis]|uniref:E3 ubiquitin-protein ligase UBR5 n=1 Tax=Clavelina lepadiformis TaxID=159417 RepID=A0ABP0H2T7_CLALP
MKPHVSNIRFIVQPLAKTNQTDFVEEEKFQEKLLRLSESAFSTYSSDVSPTLKLLQENVIKDCAVGPAHLAFLLDDGRVCRTSYTVSTKSANAQKLPDESYKDKQSGSKSESRSSKLLRACSSHVNPYNMDFLGVAGSGSWSRWGNRIGVIRSSSSNSGTASSTSARKTTRPSNASSGDNVTGSGIRLVRAGQMRGRNLPLLSGGQRVMVPASHVPEELINQVQGVLQGKSRSVIVRELQRTNLDVNLAVNNLLSRDDEDNDDLDDGVSDYIPGEELMSLLDGGGQPGEHPRVVIDADTMLAEDLLGYTLSRAPSNRNLGAPPGDKDDGDDTISRYGNSQWSDQLKNSDGSSKSKPGGCECLLGDELQWWTEEDGTPAKFKLVGAMYSDLVAVDLNGKLRQWKWVCKVPHRGTTFHSRSTSLKLDNEKIALLSACSIQASVVTEEGCVSTWMDDSVAKHTMSLDLPCFVSEPIKTERAKCLHVCSLYSVVLTDLGRLYWWGVLPFNQRKKILEKSQNTLQQNADKDSDSSNAELVVGSQVCLRNFPIYHAGAIAINVANGTPKVGRLLQSVWNLEKKSSFQILTSKSTEHKTETNTSLDSNGNVTSMVDSAANSNKRKRSFDDDESEDLDVEEDWELKEVVFVEDVRSVPVGRVTKVDKSIVAVYFSNDQQKPTEEDATTNLNSCRLLHKDDVVVMKSNAPRVLDCIQKTPRRLQFDSRLKLHCVNAMESGVGAIASTSSGKLTCFKLSLNSGKMTSQRRFPTKPESFYANKENEEGCSSKTPKTCKLLNCGRASPMLLQDYNAMLYPLIADENGGIKDPIWADLPPLFASGMGIFADSSGNRHTVSVLAFQSQLLMPLVMRRDIKGFETLISSAEESKKVAWTDVFYQSLCNERCDGQRNILHMCIEMTIPSSNKEQKDDEKIKEERSKLLASSFKTKKELNTESTSSSQSSSSTISTPSPSTSSQFMSSWERMNAVNAIANAVTFAKNTPKPQTSPVRPVDGSSSSRTASSQPPPYDVFRLIPFSDGYHPPASPLASPVSSWPPDPPYADADMEAEEGMNLSMSGSQKKKNLEKSSSQLGGWSEVSGVKDRGSRADALEILKLICKSNCTEPYLKKLLSHKDSSGYTPFMFAVAHRAYPAALVIFKAALNLTMETCCGKSKETKENNQNYTFSEFSLNEVEQKELQTMIYPSDSDADDNPLYMLCCNDTCSFTWTGVEHINQNIFECLTCGLTERLCCCTECAMVCHKGHDCKLKKTSPTAYCDCWEKCACKTLVEGDNTDRMSLLRMLLATSSLYEEYNSSGQHIVQFLVQTVARQCEEQRQYRPTSRSARMSTSSLRSRVSRMSAKFASQGSEHDTPEHDLRPPQFCREALLQMLSDWNAVYSLLMSGFKGRRDNLSMSSRLDGKEHSSSFATLHPEDEDVIAKQSGTIRLDMFTHTLIVKCSGAEYLDRLLETLIHTVQATKHKNHKEGVTMAQRFLRSVIRVFVILTAQSTPDKLASRATLYNQPAVSKCRRVFMALITLSVEELCELAESLIAPVRMGVARPTTPYMLGATNADVINGSTATFSRLPFPPRNDASDDDDDGKDTSRQAKTSKVRKRNKHSSRYRRLSSRRAHRNQGSEVRSQEVNDEESVDLVVVSQDTQPVDDESVDIPLTSNENQGAEEERQFNLYPAGGDGNEPDVVEDESDMDLTDLDLNIESESDIMDSDGSESGTVFASGSFTYEEDDDTKTLDGRSLPDRQKVTKHDDEDTDSDHWQDEVNLERRSTREQRAKARQQPHTMQWAMGTSSMIPIKGVSGGARPPNDGLGTNPGNPGISGFSAVWMNNTRNYVHQKRPKHAAADEIRMSSLSVTKAQLSRLFATCIREITHLLTTLRRGDYLTEIPTLSTVLEISYKDSKFLSNFVQRFMRTTWTWLLTIVESTECQLRYGQVLSMASSPSHLEHPHHKRRASGAPHRPRDASRGHGSLSTSEDIAARQDFLSYILSLMRSHSNEHSDLLPIVDVSSLKHIAYVLDAYIYYLRALSDNELDDDAKREAAASRLQNMSLDIGYDNSDNEEEDEEYMSCHEDLYSVALQSDPVKPGAHVISDADMSTFSQSLSSFFRRSESMTFLGCADPNAFEVPLAVALPLAEKPHLLQPSSRKEELFGRPRMDDNSSSLGSLSMSVSRRMNAADRSKKDEVEKKQPAITEPRMPLKEQVVDAKEEPPESPTVQDLSKTAPSTEDATKKKPTEEMETEPVDLATKHVAPTEEVAVETPPPAVTVTVADDVSTDVASCSTMASENNISDEIVCAHKVLGKCRLTLELFSRIFLDTVGAEPKSILYELGGFEVRETKFRKEMERLRTSQTTDLQLNVERGRSLLIQQTFKHLNQHAKRKAGSSQPLAVLRVKVLFENEPGEGTGVARSFYTAISEALLSSERLPSLEGLLPGSSSSTSRKAASMHHSLVARLCKREREREDRARGGTTSATNSGSRNINLRSFLTARYREFSAGARRSGSESLSISASPYVKWSPGRARSNQYSMDRSKQAIGDRLYPKVVTFHSGWAAKITGMLLELPAYELLHLLRNEHTLQNRVNEAVELLTSSNYESDQQESADRRDSSSSEAGTATGESRDESAKTSDEKDTKDAVGKDEDRSSEENDGGPALFYQPGKRGVYAVASWGDATDARFNAYRNVGRIIGLCLLQNELCPLPLCRHVLKVILGRKIHWHDLAFFDPTLYESLRQLVLDVESGVGDEVLEDLDLNFTVDPPNEEGGQQVELLPDGSSISVTRDNLLDYVRRYALQRMVGCCRKQLEKLRQGVYDVLPRSAMQNLTAEDLRLLVNGCGNVDVHTLISYTLFNDESGKTGASTEKLTQFKRWFWAVVDRFNSSERQELLYFWTGSPALPASEDGFQPMPTITIRPPDDHHLPTANTCISRLYVPLYSTKQILKQKLSIAIKTKNFGFV